MGEIKVEGSMNRELWRLRSMNSNSRLDIWIRFDRSEKSVSDAIRHLDAAVYPSVNVIIFKEKEDILVFRLKAGV